MTQRSFLWAIFLASCFILVSPFGGSIDLASLDSSQGITLSGASGSKIGTSIASCDFDGDGVKDTIIGAPGGTADGKVIVIFGGSSFSGIDLSNPAKSGSGFVISYSGQDGFGTQVVCLGDIDKNPGEDIAIGFTTPDSIYVIYGSPSYNADFDLTSLLTSAYSVLSSSIPESLVSIAGLGDTTGDKTGDLIVSLYDGSKYSAAVVYGVMGSTFDLATSVSSVSFRISNGAQKDPMTVASAGLFNNDGLYDFAVGNLNGGAQVVVIFGQSGGAYSDMDFSSLTYSLPQVLFVNADISYGLGASMTYAGDFDGDGFGDLLIGAPVYNSNSGAAFIIRGSGLFTADISITDIPGSGGGYQIIHGTNSGLSVGSTVFGSLTSDTPNIAVCDASTNCYIIFGTATPKTIDLDSMKSEDGFPIFSSSVSVTNPMQIFAIEDTNSDDYGDFVIGQWEAGDGLVYIVFGPNKCTSPCKTCSGLSAANWATCVTCETGFDFLFNDYCYSSCPSHSYQDSKTTCASCDGSCLDCTDSTANDCTSCDTRGSLPWLYYNACFGSCPSGSYQDSGTTCASCDGNCLECSGTDTSCTSCDTRSKAALLYESACYETCPSGSFQDSSSTCASCNSHCFECSTTAKTCTSCKNRGSYPLFYNDFCYGTCPSHSYQDSGFTCAVCDENCLNCEGSATTCTSCDSSSSFPFLYNSSCSSSCPETAPYSYLAACYTQCPTETAPDSNNACISIIPDVPQAVQTLSSADVTRQVSNEIMSTISSLTLRGLHSIRSQTIQGPVSYFIFLNVAYPSYYGQFASANFGTSRLPNPFRYTGRSMGGRASSVNSYLGNQSLLANIGYSIIFLLVCILLIPINDTALVLVEKHKKGYQLKWYYQFLKWSSVSLRWSFLINQFVSKYEDLTFFSFLGIYNAGADDDQDTLNLIVCIFGFLITVAGLVGVFFIIKMVTKKLESFSEEEKEKEEYTKNDFLGRRLVLYKDLKKDRFMTMLYPFFLMVRVFGFSFVTIFLWNQTAVQLVFLNLCAVLMFIYLIKYRPLDERGQFWMTMAYEIVAFVALFGVTVLAIYDAAGGTSENTKTGFGYLIIAANIGMLILNFISFYLEIQDYAILVYETLKTIYQKCRNKKKVTPVQIQSKDASFMSPTSSFTKGKELRTRSRLEGTPSVMAEGQGFLYEDSPELVSPNMMSEAKLSPFSSCIENGSTNERLSLIKIESSMDLKRSPTRKRLAQTRTSIILPVKEIPESQLFE